MKTYNQFINESIRDKMTPKSKEEIEKSIDNLPNNEKIKKIFKYNLQDRFTKEELLQNFIKADQKNKEYFLLVNYIIVDYFKTDENDDDWYDKFFDFIINDLGITDIWDRPGVDFDWKHDFDLFMSVLHVMTDEELIKLYEKII